MQTKSRQRTAQCEAPLQSVGFYKPIIALPFEANSLTREEMAIVFALRKEGKTASELTRELQKVSKRMKPSPTFNREMITRRLRELKLVGWAMSRKRGKEVVFYLPAEVAKEIVRYDNEVLNGSLVRASYGGSVMIPPNEYKKYR